METYRLTRPLLTGLCLLGLAGPALAATQAGKILFSQGTVTAQQAGSALRIVGKGSPIDEGDTVSTDAKGFAVIEYIDGARNTLRPASRLTIDRYREDGTLQTLAAGGIRSVSGAIAKLRPDAVKYQTATATLGIRGTSFDARLCDGDKSCQDPLPNPAARALLIKGQVSAGGRVLVKGGAVAEGDTVSTGAASIAVLAFADGSRASLGPNTRFSVKEWRYAKGQGGQAALRLVDGAARIVTGAIGKANPQAYKVHAATAVIGIRGTGFDLNCRAACADTSALGAEAPPAQSGARGRDMPAEGSRLFAHTWQGTIEVATGPYRVPVSVGQALAVNVGNGASDYLPRVPAFMQEDTLPRPDAVPGNYDDVDQTARPGLYSWVRSGRVALAQGGGEVALAPGEAGYADLAGSVPEKLPAVPAFMADDDTPLPDEFDEVQTRLQLRAQLRASLIEAPAQCTIR
ncbi:FecR family protein [Crenobacter intestini]|uniref:FecR family protein n=1 Tax=Crenobacter intestini TaxID=2563443 RepID=UPI0014582B41|nr:FecR domain-containing protein [Crenobacter intestini]